MAAVGRPRTLQSPEEMLELAKVYFAECDADESPYRIEGLALALGMSGRQRLDEYEAREEYSDNVKRLRSIVRDSYERWMTKHNPVGAIFALKNMGWTDRQDVGLSTPNGPIQTDSKIEIILRKPE